jgi:hypothetical protein
MNLNLHVPDKTRNTLNADRLVVTQTVPIPSTKAKFAQRFAFQDVSARKDSSGKMEIASPSKVAQNVSFIKLEILENLQLSRFLYQH